VARKLKEPENRALAKDIGLGELRVLTRQQTGMIR
jgi:hypothetical protein